MKINWASGDDENLENALETYLNLKPQVHDAKILSITRPSTGHSYDTLICEVVWQYDGKPQETGLVFRVEIPNYKMFHDASLEKQYRTLKALDKCSDLPVPKIYWYEDDTQYIGAKFLAMSQVVGNVPPDYLAHRDKSFVMRLSPQERHELYCNCFSTLADIHRIDTDNHFDFLKNPTNNHKRGLSQYLDWVNNWYQWVAHGRTDFSLIEKALDYLSTNQPRDTQLSLVWGDARPGNMIIGDDHKPVAVIDWEMAALGTPEVDLAWMLMWESIWYPNLSELREEGFPPESEMIAAYEQRLGRKIRELKYFKVLAATRLAIMMIRGIDKRIELKILPQETTLLNGNLSTIYLARLLGQPEPELSPDINIIADEMQ